MPKTKKPKRRVIPALSFITRTVWGSNYAFMALKASVMRDL